MIANLRNKLHFCNYIFFNTLNIMTKTGPRPRTHNVLFKIFFVLIGITIVAGLVIGYSFYQRIYSDNVSLTGKDTTYLFIPTGSTIEDVYRILFDNNYIVNKKSLQWVAEKKNYKKHVKPGRYLLSKKMSNNDLINLLRSGEQMPVNLTFNNIRTKEQLAGCVAAQIETDSVSLAKLLNDKEYVAKFGFNTNTIISLFIPNTYEFYWNTTAEQFIDRMAKEYKKFWNETRMSKAKEIGLSQSQVSTLASIVQAEQSKYNDEKATIAGLYINRINIGMLLQADPTVVFAIGNFEMQRVKTSDLAYDSPYNTYIYAGLPPGPISIPEISSIDAVLNYQKHNYLYMCAKEDFSGYHNFSTNLKQHNLYAHKYQAALRKRGIN